MAAVGAGAQVSKAMMRRGAPRKISVNNSRKLYEAINHTIERGASDRGFGGGGDNRSMRSLRLSQVLASLAAQLPPATSPPPPPAPET